MDGVVGIGEYVAVASALFCIGLLGVLVRRNALIVLMCLELMLNAVNLALVAFARYNGNMDGVILTFFTITVGAAEVAVGLAILVALFRKRKSLLFEDLNLLGR
ncbi:MAG: NADH-quinone oxidoreductase subunit NuoK [Opitutales bacterium]|jgi:NADH-quinone oxidoreductase subunit K|nr:NADH-quinone oxidoreductase subunit NuoK [Opitutales bacterium]|tara:strand:- start:1067 stop:1378 length:312 start_codon:yes stop_codon:yes gene_type:complete